MKNIFKLLLVFTLSQSNAQNLVPNPSFEDMSTCPLNLSLSLYCIGWNTRVNTPDYFHTCNPSTNTGAPSNVFGYQQPASGNGYFGFYAYPAVNPGFTEFFGRQLSSPLLVGQEYFVSFKVSFTDGSPDYTMAMNKLGLKFYSYDYGDEFYWDNPPLIDNSAHIYTNQVITDTLNWTTISGVFTADTAYEYFMIGQFFDTSQVQKVYTNPVNSSSSNSYYFVDDICVTTNPLGCSFVDVGLNELNESEKKLLRITDLMGRETKDKPNTTLIYIYSDGTTEKMFRVE